VVLIHEIFGLDDVMRRLAAGSWAIAAADVFERRHANTQHPTPMMQTLLTFR
jgi:dienelactone hydrolase